MEPRISIITLGVRDLDKSTDFYSKLGFPTEGTGDITFCKLHGTWLSLYPRTELARDAGVKNDGKGFSGVTIAHNVSTTEEVDKIIELAREVGAIITDEPHKRDWGGYSGYFQDPDGYLWEIAYNPFSPELTNH